MGENYLQLIKNFCFYLFYVLVYRIPSYCYTFNVSAATKRKMVAILFNFFHLIKIRIFSLFPFFIFYFENPHCRVSQPELLYLL